MSAKLFSLMAKSLSDFELVDGIPESYLSIDTETTGFSATDDLVTEFGYCWVENCKPVTTKTIVLDWTTHDLVQPEWLRTKLARLKSGMARSRRKCHTTWERLAKGVKPEDGMEAFAAVLVDARAKHMPIIGHNILQFDIPRIELWLREWIGLVWKFKPDELIDTQAIEKALESGRQPEATDTFHAFSTKMASYNRKGLKSNLDTHCVQKYGLVEKYDLKPERMHKAGYDALITHFLLEEYRAKSASYRRAAAGATVR